MRVLDTHGLISVRTRPRAELAVRCSHVSSDVQIDDQHDLCTLQAEPKDGVFTKLDDKETAPSRCLSIFMYTFNSDGKVNDIKFLRQPSKDEMARKVHP